MKKSLFLLVFLVLPISVFAGADTDRICADSSLWGHVTKSISVDYPGNTLYVGLPWKIAKNSGMENQTNIGLYYVVNIFDSKNPAIGERSELYSYDCISKKPKMLLKIPVNREGTFYDIDKILDDSIILHGGVGGIADQELYNVIVYDIKKSKKIFSIKNDGIMPNFATISGFIIGKEAWYIYLENFNNEGYSPQSSALYGIDKKTKKITKL